MFVALNLVKAGAVKYGLGVGADTSQGAPGDALEYSAAAGAAAFLFGKEDLVAKCLMTYALHDGHPGFLAPGIPVLSPTRRTLHR